MRGKLGRAAVLLALLAGTAGSAHAQTKVVIGSVPGIAAASTYIADAKGYFRDAGVDVQIADLASAADASAVADPCQLRVFGMAADHRTVARLPSDAEALAACH